ncbi:ornithine cyclodeaminase [Klebsormidium nitens]|uniref:Ornithine cyclodeaminase n=1 Tax=Klebsormidium nitens TaxID=105231 RepID=A0A1Y1I2S7_KLENI|nr:ornithine cyclodeaminase [Klebsormidium nitens]|eukprot:GAQ85224.1 ornithine cyclodeaminase [Klebsormidium nitens]
MKVFSKRDIDGLLDYDALINALNEAFASEHGVEAPGRQHYKLPEGLETGGERALLLMPAWDQAWDNPSGNESFIGVKTVTVFPDNSKNGLSAIAASYLLLSGNTGQPLACMDGTAITLWRTACTSALAARFLARTDSTQLLMVGAGALAPFLIRAHLTVRPSITRVNIWNRSRSRAETLASSLSSDPFLEGVGVSVASDLEAAAREADVISTATLSKEPITLGAWLKPGAHLDLVGAFTLDMRETDDEAVRRSTIFADRFDALRAEGGDVMIPYRAGVIDDTSFVADLAMLTRGAHPGRRSPNEITLFKSVGLALEDLACAKLLWRKAGDGSVT